MPSPNFRRVLKSIERGNILTPIIRAALTDPTFTAFQITVDGWEPRPYDGWFHPSTHSSWTARQLYLYLTKPDLLVPERPGLLFVLSVTQGKFWHKFVQRLLLSHGVMTEDEVPLLDEEFNRKGNTDGRLRTGEMFEFKTASERVIAHLRSVEDLKEWKPAYYSQTQDYLDMAGVAAMRYLVMQLSAPFAMEEFVVPADLGFQQQQREKYTWALEAARRKMMPEACCALRSPEAKACPVRDACPIGAAS